MPCSPTVSRLSIDDLADGGDDVRIGAAAAEIAAHPLADLMLRAGMSLFEQGDGGADLPRSAEAALEGVVPDEGCLDRMQFLAFSHTLDGGDGQAGDAD